MTPDLQALATLDRVIHEPARLMIMTVLYAAEEADFLYLQRECALTQGNLSSHLAKLENAGYVLIEKMFKGKYPLTVCSLTQKGRTAFGSYVQKIRVVSEPPSSGKLGRVRHAKSTV
ncbi:MAG TPA: transcriptional regulator [Candidatus Sulfotelmatobacter sp.]